MQSSWQGFASIFAVFGNFLVLIRILVYKKARNKACEVGVTSSVPTIRSTPAHRLQAQKENALTERAR